MVKINVKNAKINEQYVLVVAKKGMHIPDPFRMNRPIETEKPVKVRKSTYWNRRIKQGDVTLFNEGVKKVNKKVNKKEQE